MEGNKFQAENHACIVLYRIELSQWLGVRILVQKRSAAEYVKWALKICQQVLNYSSLVVAAKMD